jgi:type VI secretion system protein ImpH
LNGVAQLGRTAWLGEMRIHQHQQRPATVRVTCPAVPSQSSLSRSST